MGKIFHVPSLYKTYCTLVHFDKISSSVTQNFLMQLVLITESDQIFECLCIRLWILTMTNTNVYWMKSCLNAALCTIYSTLWQYGLRSYQTGEYETEKYFCLRINIPKRNFWILRIGLMGSLSTIACKNQKFPLGTSF